MVLGERPRASWRSAPAPRTDTVEHRPRLGALQAGPQGVFVLPPPARDTGEFLARGLPACRRVTAQSLQGPAQATCV